MNYNTNQSIFIQIAERICDRVLSGNYKADSRIPSVRELAVEMEVNPNTVMRSFERLQANDYLQQAWDRLLRRFRRRAKNP